MCLRIAYSFHFHSISCLCRSVGLTPGKYTVYWEILATILIWWFGKCITAAAYISRALLISLYRLAVHQSWGSRCCSKHDGPWYSSQLHMSPAATRSGTHTCGCCRHCLHSTRAHYLYYLYMEWRHKFFSICDLPKFKICSSDFCQI